MKTLRVYGDSYAADSELCWATQLGKQFNIPVVNKAINGSSTEYSMINFTQDINDSVINDNDIVCFLTSTVGRLNLKYISEHRPQWAGQPLSSLNTLPKNSSNAWYWDNKDYIRWFMVNQDDKLLQINHESYIHTLKDYAWSKPNAIFVLLQKMLTYKLH